MFREKGPKLLLVQVTFSVCLYGNILMRIRDS